MATAITKYRANDGTEFNSAERADQHDGIIVAVDRAMSHLTPRPKALEENKGYVQHTRLAVLRASTELFALARHRLGEEWVARQKSLGHDEEEIAMHVKGIYGRIADGCAPLDRAYTRLLCIDEQNREWQQPYYAINPSAERRMVQLNKEAPREGS
jgi:hypothetical protein